VGHGEVCRENLEVRVLNIFVIYKNVQKYFPYKTHRLVKLLYQLHAIGYTGLSVVVKDIFKPLFVAMFFFTLCAEMTSYIEVSCCDVLESQGDLHVASFFPQCVFGLFLK
jgi:hypothetical protein